MRDLSRETGMSLAGLYYYFESKERLLYLIQKHTFTTIVERLKTRLEGVSDAEERPFMIRALQVKTLNRDKPARDRELRPIITRLAEATRLVGHASAVLGQLEPLLREFWNVPAEKEVCIAGFQERGLESLLRAYLGTGAADAWPAAASCSRYATQL